MILQDVENINSQHYFALGASLMGVVLNNDEAAFTIVAPEARL